MPDFKEYWNMKITSDRLIFFLLLMPFCMIAPLTAEAQSKELRNSGYSKEDYLTYRKHDIYIQYGTPSIAELAPAMSDRTIENNGMDFDHKNHWYSGIAAAGYNYYFRHNITFGGYFSAQASGMSMYDERGRFVYDNNVTTFTVLANAHWIFFRRGATELSMGLHIGVSYMDESVSDFDPSVIRDFKPENSQSIRAAYHLTALKARFGGNVGGFVELGFGYRGILNAGLSVKI